MLTPDMIRPGQRRVITELKDSLGVQLILPMGGGKTVSVFTAIKEMLDGKLIRSAIVTAPKRVATVTWPTEHRGWSHLRDLRVALLDGTPGKRLVALHCPADVYVVGHDLLPWLLDVLDERYSDPDDPRRDLLAIDELSKFRDPRGARAKRLLASAGDFKAIWGFTGTPRPGDEVDQFMPLQIVSAGGAFSKTFDDWRRANFMPLDHQGHQWKIHEFAKPVLMKTVNEWSVSIPADETAEVTYESGDEHDYMVDLTDEQQRDMATLDKKLLIELGVGAVDLRDPDEELLLAITKAVATGKMAQVLQGFAYHDGTVMQSYDVNPKLERLIEIDEEAGGERLLIPYWYREELRQLEDALPGMENLGADTKDVQGLVERWNAGEILRLAIHPASAGHGLNLQFGGHRILWYHQCWSPELYAQLVKRLARPGQKYPVISHRIRARHWLEDMRIRRVEAEIVKQAEFIAKVRKI